MSKCLILFLISETKISIAPSFDKSIDNEYEFTLELILFNSNFNFSNFFVSRN